MRKGPNTVKSNSGGSLLGKVGYAAETSSTSHGPFMYAAQRPGALQQERVHTMRWHFSPFLELSQGVPLQ